MSEWQCRRPFGQRHLNRRQFAWMSAGAALLPVLGRPSAVFGAAIQTGSVSGKVTQWVYPLGAGGDQTANETMWSELVSDFQGQYPDVEVSVEVQPWANRNEKLTTALSAGAGPDVGYLNADLVPQHAKDGNLEPLEDVIADDADFAENARTNLTYDGTLYAVPILGSVTTLIYNGALFDQLGLTEFPTTWDELLAIGPAFRDAGLYLTTYPGALEQTLNLTYFPLLWQAGGEVVSEDGTAAAFNSAEGLDALNFVVTLFNEGYVNKDEGVTAPPQDASVSYQGKVGVLLAGDNSTAKQFSDVWPEDAVRVGAPLTRSVQTSYGTTAGFGVFSGAKDKDAAKAWVKYITSPEPMTKIVESGGYIPPRTSLSEIYADDPLLSEFQQYAPLMHGDVRNPSARQIISAVAPYIQAAFLGQSSPEDALASAESDVNRLLERSSR